MFHCRFLQVALVKTLRAVLRRAKARARWECYRIARRLKSPLRRLHTGTKNQWEDDFRQSRKALQQLCENLLRFWFPQVLDTENGGYRLHHDLSGRWKGPANKNVVGQARTTWFLSYLARSRHGKEEYLQAARHGYEFLMEYMRDPQWGGFYWEVDSTGKQVTKSGKHLYGQAFALFAISEFAMAANDMTAAEAAQKLFETIERMAHDKEFGGYREFFQRDWNAAPLPERGYLGAMPEMKSLNTHLHLMEALTTYFSLTKHFSLPGKALARERLTELLIIQSNAVVRKLDGACTNRHRRDWTPLRGQHDDRVNYGHDLENISFLIEACTAMGIPFAPLMNLFRTLFEQTARYGFDRRRGGFYASGFLQMRADSLRKIWWIQAEALLAIMHLFLKTRDALYWHYFLRTLSWILGHQLDHGCGEWHQRIERDGKPSGDKAGPWKTPYHTGRAVFSCLDMLNDLDAKPAGAA
jgi:mannose/cellobiose epimerase-like protein (N-acyl-D-glucosamine 2-epimerase family)